MGTHWNGKHFGIRTKPPFITNPSLCGVQKLNYLRTHLSEEAARAIEAIRGSTLNRYKLHTVHHDTLRKIWSTTQDYKGPRTNPTTTKACVFCKGSHKRDDCTVVKDPVTRKQIVFQVNLCLNSHRVSQCKSKNRCRQCRQKHHTSLYQGTKESPEQPKPAQNAQKNAKDASVQCACTSSAAVTEQVPTPTYTAEDRSGYSRNPQQGSDRTHSFRWRRPTFVYSRRISKETRSRARQDRNSTPISVRWFSHVSKGSWCRNSASKSRHWWNYPHPSCYHPSDCCTTKKLSDHRRIRDLPRLKGLKLADPITSDDQFKITLLIDHYWDIVEDKIIRGAGPTAAKLKIGYLLSGPTATRRPTLELNATILNAMITTEREDSQTDSSRDSLIPKRSKTNVTTFHTTHSCLSHSRIPAILNDLITILIRCYHYALTADIEKAFLHINLDKEDRDAMRFFCYQTQKILKANSTSTVSSSSCLAHHARRLSLTRLSRNTSTVLTTQLPNKWRSISTLTT